MTATDLDRDVARLLDIIDQRIALAAGRPVELMRGSVADVVSGLRVALVQLDGSSTPVPVPYPALPVTLVAGDEVVVQRRRDGWLMVSDVLGRDAAAGGAHPDLATHDALGLATDAELNAAIAAHAALTDPHTVYILKSLLTTRGDIIARGATDPARLALGSAGKFLRSDGTDPGWGYSGLGWMPFAYPIGWAASDTVGTNSALIAVSGGSGGAGAQPFLLTAPMAIESVTIRQAASASARSCEFRLYYDDGSTTLKFVTGTDGTLSFTPSAADDRTGSVSTPGTILLPGVYWLVLRNTSASQTFIWGKMLPTVLAGNGSIQDNTGGIAALGSTVDLTTWDTKQAHIFAARLNGRAYGQSAAF